MLLLSAMDEKKRIWILAVIAFVLIMVAVGLSFMEEDSEQTPVASGTGNVIESGAGKIVVTIEPPTVEDRGNPLGDSP